MFLADFGSLEGRQSNVFSKQRSFRSIARLTMARAIQLIDEPTVAVTSIVPIGHFMERFRIPVRNTVSYFPANSFFKPSLLIRF